MELGLIDKIIDEPLGGAHRNYPEIMQRVGTTLATELAEAQSMPLSDLLTRRFDRLMSYGEFSSK